MVKLTRHGIFFNLIGVSILTQMLLGFQFYNLKTSLSDLFVQDLKVSKEDSDKIYQEKDQILLQEQ